MQEYTKLISRYTYTAAFIWFIHIFNVMSFFVSFKNDSKKHAVMGSCHCLIIFWDICDAFRNINVFFSEKLIYNFSVSYIFWNKPD